MNVTCTKCGKKYVISDDKVAGKSSVKIRCKQCQNLISVSVSVGGEPAALTGAPPPPKDWEEEPTRAAPAPDFNVTWFAMIAGKQQGPFDIGALKLRIDAKDVSLRTYLWRPGMPDWKRASEIPEVSAVFAGVAVRSTGTAPMPQSPDSSRSSATTRDSAASDVGDASGAPTTATRAEASTSPASSPSAAEQRAASAAEGALALEKLFPPDEAEARAAPAAAPQPQGDGPPVPLGAEGASASSATDAFPRLGEEPIGEATRFFIAKAGVNKRNPPWKIALVVAGVVAFVAGSASILQALHIVPAVTRTTDDGREVQESFFSPAGMSGLREILTGEAERRKEAAQKRRKLHDAVARPAPAGALPGNEAPEPEAAPAPHAPTKDKELVALYNENELPTRGPRLRENDPPTAPQPNAAGLSQEAAIKVVAANSKSFQQCLDNALHRNPNLAVGNITILLVVGPSGGVKSASIEPKKHESADWAQCMVAAGKRIYFPASDGDTELELPFKVGVAIGP